MDVCLFEEQVCCSGKWRSGARGNHVFIRKLLAYLFLQYADQVPERRGMMDDGCGVQQKVKENLSG